MSFERFAQSFFVKQVKKCRKCFQFRKTALFNTVSLFKMGGTRGRTVPKLGHHSGCARTIRRYRAPWWVGSKLVSWGRLRRDRAGK